MHQSGLCGCKQTQLTSSFPRLLHAVLVYVQRKQHVRVAVLFLGGVGPLAAVASCDGCIQKPGGLLRGRGSQLRLVLELIKQGKLLTVATAGLITTGRQPNKSKVPVQSEGRGIRFTQTGSVQTPINLFTRRIICRRD